MIESTVKLADGTTLGKIGHGLMYMTWIPNPVSDEVAFESIKTSLGAVPPGVKMLINSGEFYGNPPDGTANLDMISRFFEKYPEYADKAFLAVKGGTKPGLLEPDSSSQNLARSVDNCLAHLREFKKMDLFQSARVDQKVPVEDAMRSLLALQKEGKFDHIGISECSEKSLRRAAAVAPIAMVEIEVSPIAYEEETKKVIAAAAEIGALIQAYSPLGKGLLTGALTKSEDFQEGDRRRQFTQFQEENLRHNLRIVETIKAIATAKKVTPPQVSIAWVSSRGQTKGHVFGETSSVNLEKTRP